MRTAQGVLQMSEEREEKNDECAACVIYIYILLASLRMTGAEQMGTVSTDHI